MKISKEKRNTVVLIVLLTVGGACGIYFGLINFQKMRLADFADLNKSAEAKLAKIERSIRNADQIETDLKAASKKLAEIEEEQMASGDLYGAVVFNIKRFKLPHAKVDMPQFSPLEVKDVNLLPKFPYRQATLTVGGTAYFHDFGRFLADFENTFPYVRVLNIDLEPSPVTQNGEKEKLSFKMDIVTLIKPGAGANL